MRCMSVSLASTHATNTAMLGLGAYRPARVVSNDEVCEKIDSSDEWIQTRSGIQNRHFAEPEESIVEMGVIAGQRALDAAGMTAAQIDTVLVASSSTFTQVPHSAPQIAVRLGIDKPGSFDLVAGCAGFCHGLAVASDLVKAGSARNILLIGGDQMSLGLDMTDRGSAFIFGDGAGAVVVGPSEEAKIGPVVWGSDGEQGAAIRQEPSWSDIVISDDYRRPALQMEGPSVFRWAAFSMGKVARQILAASNVTVDDLDAFIPHQANQRITEVIVHSLKLPETVAVADDIVDTANTSAGSIPLAMEKMLRTGQAEPGDLALLIGFGSGLTYAGQLVRLPGLSAE